ncbi:hypothetical protein BLL52_1619 [Rhodoferax antarcticus ANT.BR]|uniref:Uncharacterized protein n=1 Tax=Rhodoferax antarcticus ANT.BR TaxID=1111071 RepID=A0A1Q8YFU7_9BURK|nr:hypothetical protein BLL52_1619 [Rhodoferax antarcticus ANT.BR]
MQAACHLFLGYLGGFVGLQAASAVPLCGWLVRNVLFRTDRPCWGIQSGVGALLSGVPCARAVVTKL